MATVKITRSNEYINRIRNIKLLLDGKKIDTIANSETKEFEIAEGIHTLQAKIDWCSSNKITFTVSEKQSKAFELTSFAKNKSFGGLALIYHTTFGASKYLNLIEKEI